MSSDQTTKCMKSMFTKIEIVEFLQTPGFSIHNSVEKFHTSEGTVIFNRNIFQLSITHICISSHSYVTLCQRGLMLDSVIRLNRWYLDLCSVLCQRGLMLDSVIRLNRWYLDLCSVLYTSFDIESPEVVLTLQKSKNSAPPSQQYQLTYDVQVSRNL